MFTLINSLASRRKLPELMDDLSLSDEELQAALRELDWLNSVCATARQVARVLESKKTLSILDIGCGSGKLLGDLKRAWELKGNSFEGMGVDFNARSFQSHWELPFLQCDVLKDDLPSGFEVIVASLFFHHLSRDEAVGLLKKMKALKPQMIVISDLKRSLLGYLLTWLATRLCCKSTIVHYDSLVSVRAAFTPLEFMAIAEESGLSGGSVIYQFPERFLYCWRAHA